MTLYSFDLDDTLFFTPDPEEGKKIWTQRTGLDWPYQGWWGKAETLDTEVFYIPINPWVYNKYLEATADPDSYIVLATGRLKKVPGMKENIDRLLNQNNLSFDEIQLTWGGDTYTFKTRLFESLIKKTKCDHFIMYDDRHIHLVRFYDWAREQSCKVTVVDVKNKIARNFN